MHSPITLAVALAICGLLIIIAGLKVYFARLRARYDSAGAGLAEHLGRNVVAVGRLDATPEWRFPAEFYHKSLWLAGEIHGYRAMYGFDFELLTHLHQRAGVRDYLAELGAIEAAMVNAYLDSGQDAHIRGIFDRYKGVMRWSNADFPEKLARIRAYNQGLSPDQRIRFTGIDQVQNFAAVDEWLGRSGDRLEGAETRLTAALYLPLVEAADPATLTGGATTKAEVLHTLRLMANGLEREAVIFENYAYQVKSGALGDRPSYGLWGLSHVLRAPIDGGFMPFALRVATSDLPAATSMATLCAYSDQGEVLMANNEMKGLFKSKRYTGTPTRFLENDGPLYYLEGLGDLRRAFAAAQGKTRLSGTGLCVFDLRGPQSPFAAPTGFGQIHTLYRFGTTLDQPFKPSVEVMDYAMIVRGSASARRVPL